MVEDTADPLPHPPHPRGEGRVGVAIFELKFMNIKKRGFQRKGG
jgi:hypothetical protein